MNLTLQTRRAMITLALAAAAVVCVAARSAVVSDDTRAATLRGLHVESTAPAQPETSRVVIAHVRSGELITFIRHQTARKAGFAR